MNDPQFSAESCQETAGFLFSHACGEMAAYECAECQKKVCQRHAIDSGGTLLCVTCMKKQRATNPSQSSSSSYDDYPPYFYGDHYGYGYGYGRHRYGWHTTNRHHDFTDSDEAAVSGDETDAAGASQFEEKLGAS